MVRELLIVTLLLLLLSRLLLFVVDLSVVVGACMFVCDVRLRKIKR
jgi:hypothetical protein